MMSTRVLHPELAAKAAKELNEDSSRTSTDIETIQQWLKKQPHLAHIKISNQRVLSFLRGCKFSMEKCKQKLDMYYSMRNFAPEMFDNRDPFDTKVQAILKLGAMLPLLGLSSPSAERLYLIRLGAIDSSDCTLTDMLKVSFMITDILLDEDDNYSISGETTLIDLKNVSMGLLSQFTPGLAKKVAISVEKSFPVRQKGIQFLNMASSIETTVNMLKGLLNEKVKNRLMFHGKKLDSLHKHISKHLLPKDLGGDAESFQELTDHWKQKVESRRDWFLEDSYKSDESKRPGTPRSSEELFGIDGSFRKLNYD